MKNIWLHSIVVIVLGSVLLAAIQVMLVPVAYRLSTWMPNPADAMDAIGAPLVAFATLAPALVLGWFTRRHPLLVGAAAGAAASWLVNHAMHSSGNGASLLGDVIASAMIVAVAALAGRALRYRFTATPAAVVDHSRTRD